MALSGNGGAKVAVYDSLLELMGITAARDALKEVLDPIFRPTTTPPAEAPGTTELDLNFPPTTGNFSPDPRNFKFLGSVTGRDPRVVAYTGNTPILYVWEPEVNEFEPSAWTRERALSFSDVDAIRATYAHLPLIAFTPTTDGPAKSCPGCGRPRKLISGILTCNECDYEGRPR
jgi:hypothetical protein